MSCIREYRNDRIFFDAYFYGVAGTHSFVKQGYCFLIVNSSILYS